MAAKSVNVYGDYRFQVDVKIPNASGALALDAAGTMLGLELRLSRTKTGAAIHPSVDQLSAIYYPRLKSRQYVDVDTAVLVARILPAVGVGGSFFGIWRKPGDKDYAYQEFIVATEENISA